MNRGTGCTFAKIIENRGQQNVPVLYGRKEAHIRERSLSSV